MARYYIFNIFGIYLTLLTGPKTIFGQKLNNIFNILWNMAKTLDKYIYYIGKFNYIQLKQLPRLTKANIKNNNILDHYKIILFAYYNYYSELDKYLFIEQNYLYSLFHIIYMNKLNTFKYFLSRGVKFLNVYYYKSVIAWGSNKLLPYYESKGFYLNDYNPFDNISLSNKYRLKVYKYLFNIGFNINIELMNKNNLFTKEINSYKSNLKELKYLKSKGINIYNCHIKDLLYRISYHKYKNPNLLFLRKLYSPNYYSGKILYI